MGVVGFPPSAEGSEQYRERSRDELLDAVEKALDELDWNFEDEGGGRYVATFPFQFFVSSGERMTIDVHKDGTIDVRSETTFPLAWIDWRGCNQKRVDAFLDYLEDVLRPRKSAKGRDRDD